MPLRCVPSLSRSFDVERCEISDLDHYKARAGHIITGMAVGYSVRSFALASCPSSGCTAQLATLFIPLVSIQVSELSWVRPWGLVGVSPGCSHGAFDVAIKHSSSSMDMRAHHSYKVAGRRKTYSHLGTLNPIGCMLNCLWYKRFVRMWALTALSVR